MLGRNS